MYLELLRTYSQAVLIAKSMATGNSWSEPLVTQANLI